LNAVKDGAGDIKYMQTPAGRSLNYGTFMLDFRGVDTTMRSIKNLPKPNELFLRVVEQLLDSSAVEARVQAGERNPHAW
jgi:hypothetical protein